MFSLAERLRTQPHTRPETRCLLPQSDPEKNCGVSLRNTPSVEDMAITAKKGAAGGKPKNSLKRKAETQVEKKPVAGMKRKRTEYVVSEKKTEDKRKRHKEMNTLEGDLRKIFQERRNARDARCLFVLMQNYDDKVEFEKAVNARRKSKRTFFVDYASPEEAKQMLKVLGKRKDILVCRSVVKPQNANETIMVDPCQLYMENIPANTKLKELKSIFPTALHISYRSKKSFAKITYSDAKLAEEAFRKADNLLISGNKMTVLYTTFHTKEVKKATAAPPKKRLKVDPEVEQKQEEEMEEEDEEEEEEEDDDDDDDEEEA
ncbi:DNA ligase 1-like [Penaeus monodon]|uniref:DNA ligase 1-like n=1 Tax=Penaeus monodon TaxID=6687 RepID=UPI0018A6E7CF|nr:DNA ligase 1-like [Penaeus monodon]